MTTKHRTLSDIAIIERQSVKPTDIAGEVLVGLENIDESGNFVNLTASAGGSIKSTKFRFDSRHILYGKLRPYLKKIARPDFAGICSTDILPILPRDCVNRNYLYHYLRSPWIVALATQRSTGANLPRLSPTELAKFPVLLPTMEEQQRLAYIFDSIERLIGLRRQSLKLLHSFRQSLFVEMFGNEHEYVRWDLRRLSECWQMIRNGVSPSTGGLHEYSVLTLAAITGDQFDLTACKKGFFEKSVPQNQLVDTNDFLVCRGNGNKRLVGRGKNALAPKAPIVFPDTMIALRLNQELIEPAFLETFWDLPFVRRQIEGSARTTNGTYKINQQALEALNIILPPKAMQVEFGRRIEKARSVEELGELSLTALLKLQHTTQTDAFSAMQLPEIKQLLNV